MQILARAVGRRKEAVAQVQLVRGTGRFLINEKPAEQYLQFNTFSLLKIRSPFEALSADLSNQKATVQTEATPEQKISNTEERSSGVMEPRTLKMMELDTIIKVKGGGLIGQVDAIKLAVARALCQMDEDVTSSVENSGNAAFETDDTSFHKETRKIFKLKGFLTQDARVKERRKYGLKKARKAPQFSKR